MKEERWKNQLKGRLKDRSELLPADGWERLERDLAGGGAPLSDGVTSRHSVSRRRLRRLRWVLPLLLMAAVWPVTLWLMHSEPVQEVARIVEILPSESVNLASEADLLPVQTLPVEASQLAVARPKSASSASRNTETQSLNAETELSITAPVEALTEAVAPERECEAEARPAEEASPAEDTDKKEETVRLARKKSLYEPLSVEKKKRRGGWSVALAVAGSASLEKTQGDVLAFLSLPAANGGEATLDPEKPGEEDEEENGGGAETKGVPAITRDRSESNIIQLRENIKSYNHKQPISVGLNVRKQLAYGFSVETGLTYTLLMSDVSLAGVKENVSQKLHYLGIPLRANWDMLARDRFTLYLSAGGAVEKCVYGTFAGERQTVGPLQFSLLGAVGAQYNLSRRVALYVEPGVSYYFDDGSSVETIRKENPCNFTLQGGIRLRY